MAGTPLLGLGPSGLLCGVPPCHAVMDGSHAGAG